MNKILVFHLGSLGDTIVALPCLKHIAHVFKDSQISMLTAFSNDIKAPSIDSIIGPMGLIQEYMKYPPGKMTFRKAIALRKTIKKWKPDCLVYLLQNTHYLKLLRDYVFFKSCGITHIIGLNLNPSKIFREKISDTKYEYEGMRFARTIAKLGKVDLDKNNLVFLENEKAEAVQHTQLFNHIPYIICSIGTKLFLKDWEQKNWISLISNLTKLFPNVGLIGIGSPDEANRTEELLKLWKGPILNLCGKTSPRIAAIVMQKALCFIGHDSGPMHLAANQNIPCIAIFSGHSLPGVWFPYGEQHKIYYKITSCNNCHKTVCGNNKKCILSTTPAEVLKGCESIIESRLAHFKHNLNYSNVKNAPI